MDAVLVVEPCAAAPVSPTCLSLPNNLNTRTHIQTFGSILDSVHSYIDTLAYPNKPAAAATATATTEAAAATTATAAK